MFSFNKNSPAVEDMTFANLLPGNYYYELQGELSKVGGTKFYALDSLATPSAPTPAVPEPETYAMLLAGLGVVGMAVRRRTK